MGRDNDTCQGRLTELPCGHHGRYESTFADGQAEIDLGQ